MEKKTTMWWYSETKNKIIGIIEETECPMCGKKTNMRVVKQTTFKLLTIIPWWSSTYAATCGSCFSSVQITKEYGKKLEEQVKLLERGATQ
jgi:hypothetical protein